MRGTGDLHGIFLQLQRCGTQTNFYQRKYHKNFCPNCGSQEIVEKAIPCFHYGPAPTEAVCQKCGCKF